MAISGPTSGPELDDDDAPEAGGFNEINVVPLVDIMLVLLVILMLTSTTAIVESGAGQGSGFKVTLPTASENEELSSVDEQLVVAVLEDGTVAVRGEIVSTTELEALFAAEAAKDKGRLVLVQADEEAVHRRVVQVMELARKAGLNNLAIATQPDKP